MVIPILIDTASISEAYANLDRQGIDDICDNIAKTLAARYASQLEQEAIHALHQTRKRYIRAINVVNTGRLEGTVILDFSKDPLVRMIEEGASPWDMKDKMLMSQKAKVSKNGGRYITVPFRIGSPGAIGDSDVFSSIMPAEVYDVAKELVAPAGGDSRQLVTDDLPDKFKSPAKRAEIKDSAGKVLFKEYEHKSSIFTGVYKSNDAVTGQNTYGSFRRISEELIAPNGKHVGSDPDSWINKGIEQYNLVSKALSNFNQETEVQVAMNNEFARLGLM